MRLAKDPIPPHVVHPMLEQGGGWDAIKEITGLHENALVLTTPPRFVKWHSDDTYMTYSGSNTRYSYLCRLRSLD